MEEEMNKKKVEANVSAAAERLRTRVSGETDNDGLLGVNRQRRATHDGTVGLHIRRRR